VAGKHRPLSANLLTRVALPERYELLRHVANGGMASVWCAQDVALGRRVAIKLLDERFEHDEWAVRRFQREARTAARLSGHRNVVTIFDVGESEGRAFIVMQFLAGGTVAHALRRGPVECGEALRWLREAASALDHAHRCGVVHRDIKPGNLLLDVERVLHIGDFGIARLATEDTITSTRELLGTAAYLSPEQALGQRATEASDRYSLAVAAFELLSGERPFSAHHFAAQARQHIEAQPPSASRLNRSLPQAVDSVLARGMAKNPSERWSSAEAMVGAIESALTRRPASTAARRPSTVGFADPRAGRRRAAALGALATGVLAAAVVAAAADQGAGTRVRARSAGHRARPIARAARSRNPASVAPKRAPTRAAGATEGSTPAAAVTAAGVLPGSPTQLEARGHQLMLDSSYGAAIAVLRQAVAAATPASLTYAYALYDLGRSLRLAGQPQAAIPILARRLQISDQTGVVRQELALAARQAGGGSIAGQPTGASASVSPTVPWDARDGGKHKHGRGDHQAD
jgi:tRNA A-37 threonylcarbamoyl transferase component Bud32